MKTCTRCYQAKDESGFFFKNKTAGKRQSICKACFHPYFVKYFRERRDVYAAHRLRNKKIYGRRNRTFIDAFLRDHPCVDCGESDPIVLQFDHVIGSKSHDISTVVTGGRSIEVLAAEIAKCVVRCANCHCRRTAATRGYWKAKKQGISLLMTDFGVARWL